jgi:hypothetical protein
MKKTFYYASGSGILLREPYEPVATSQVIDALREACAVDLMVRGEEGMPQAPSTEGNGTTKVVLSSEDPSGGDGAGEPTWGGVWSKCTAPMFESLAGSDPVCLSMLLIHRHEALEEEMNVVLPDRGTLSCTVYSSECIPSARTRDAPTIIAKGEVLSLSPTYLASLPGWEQPVAPKLERNPK